MPRDILSEYGKDSSGAQAPRATSGGVTSAKPISNYKAPQGPTNIGDSKGPGIHGHNHGMASCTTPSGTSGSAGIGGTTHKSGSQRG